MDSNFKLLVYWKFKWVDERLYYMPEELDDSAIPLSFLEVKKDQVWFPDFTSTEGKEILQRFASFRTHQPFCANSNVCYLLV